MRRHLFPLIGHGIVGHGHLGYSLADILGLSTKPHHGGLKDRLRSLWFWLLDTVRRPWCFVVGCNYDTPEFRSWCLYTCTRCGCEMLGRTFDDLQPAPADDDHYDYSWPEDDR